MSMALKGNGAADKLQKGAGWNRKKADYFRMTPQYFMMKKANTIIFSNKVNTITWV